MLQTLNIFQKNAVQTHLYYDSLTIMKDISNSWCADIRIHQNSFILVSL